jgi:hypothetical protein
MEQALTSPVYVRSGTRPYPYVDLPAGAELVTGEQRSEVGQLEGRANKRGIFGGSGTPTDNLIKLEWTVRAPNGGMLTITAASTRAGTDRATVELA